MTMRPARKWMAPTAGWTRRLEHEHRIRHGIAADDFLEDWADCIVGLGPDSDIDPHELRREAEAWGRAMHAFHNWRAAS